MNLVASFPRHDSDVLALIVGDRQTSFGQLDERVARWRGGFAEAGLGVGDRLVVLSGNDEIFVTAYLAGVSAGLIVVPLNPHVPGPEVERQLAVLAAAAVVVGPAGASVWAAVADDSVAENTAVGGREAGGAGGDSTGAGIPAGRVFEAENGSELGPSVGVLDEAEPVEGVAVDAEAPAVLLFTSGTSGDSKPAVLTHDNLRSSLQSLAEQPGVDLSVQHRVLAVIPLFHVFGLNVIVNLGMSIGATMVLTDHVDAAGTGQVIADRQVTMVAGPPTLWAQLANDPTAEQGHYATVQIAVSGAAKLPTETWQLVHEKLGLDVREGYGLTETCAILTSAAGIESPPGSVGRPLAGVEVRLVDGDGEDAYVGDPGEVWVRGPMVSPGYWSGPDELQTNRDSEGWFRTGDLGVVDDEGHVSIVDRIKDLIIVSGFNVAPAEVEDVLHSHPAISQAGVVGEADPATGERVVAYVVIEEGQSPDAEELRRHAMDRLARYKVPRRIELVSELPRGPVVGKLRRRELGAGG